MSIVCPKCGTEYALDPSQLSVQGTPVQCSACEHTFTAYPQGTNEGSSGAIGNALTAVMPPGEPTRSESKVQRELSGPLQGLAKARSPHAGLGGSGDLPARKKVAAPDGMEPPPAPLKSSAGRLFLAQGDRIYKVKDIATLQRWVVEKRVLPNDRLSRDGKSWDVVSSVAELRPFFTVLDQLKQTKRALSKVRESNSKKLKSTSVPEAPVPEALASGRRDTPPPVLPPDRPAQPLLGSESLAAQERAVVATSENVLVGAATPVGMVALAPVVETAPAPVVEGVPALVDPPLETTGPVSEDDAMPAEGSAQTDPPSSPPAQSKEVSSVDESGLIEPAPEAVATPPTVENLGLPADELNRAESIPEGQTEAGLDESFFGAGMSTGELSDHDATGVSSSFDRESSRPITVTTQAQADPHSPAPPGTFESSDGLEGSQVPVESLESDYDPYQTFGEVTSASEETKGAGGAFYAFLLLSLSLAVLGIWYFFMGPGSSAVFGDPLAGLKPPASASTAEPLAATPSKPLPSDATDVAEDAVAEDAVAEDAVAEDDVAAPTPTATAAWMEPAAPTDATPAPTPVAAAKATPAPRKPAPVVVKQAPKSAGQDAASLVNAGNRARDRGDYRGAAKAYSGALELKPNDVGTQIEIGWAYIELGRNSAAVTHFLRAVRLSPSRSEARYGLGLAYQTMGQNQQAITEYRKVVELDPNGRDTREVQALLRQLE